ncbi:uncharacterized protein HMPREF1541_10923 [Cyphellophora europaea CBS 101466]|uniref:ATP-dependent DNA ligase family profile domain-containing protein n=1 Tax=Cyphellophora europaea (strain CBS 101466) TaxID=1220924 RepID=W2S7N3_CYPE1|nr:uncharacterized protein HMPREF1541_10923 [Cyphellophora europaea CBS 101466]ETN44058.1 hypothetical protein HMPREF1541_10923 [Cyphellophora europaea CBS 101466]
MYFKALCDFWQTIAGQNDEHQRERTIRTWFQGAAGDDLNTGSGLLALTSCLFPHRRRDRVYGLREKSLADIAIRAWSVGHSRARHLHEWQSSHGAPDFAATVRTLVEEGGEVAHVHGPPTLEEINHVLDHLASGCPFSSPKIRASFQHENHSPRQGVIDMLQRMSGLEAEWMCRLILGNLGQVQLPEELVMNFLHPALGTALQVHDGLVNAVALIMTPQGDGESSMQYQHMSKWRPQLGMAIHRPTFEKARSIQHCRQLLGRQLVYVERKYDGEYCQIHVRLLPAGETDIKIFSKSGRDSTADRHALIPTIHQCLNIGKQDCQVNIGCVLIGEMVVWNDAQQDIMPFYNIRRYILRTGRRLGCGRDSPPLPGEHLMIVLFDCLLLDNVDCMFEPYVQRRKRLAHIVRPVPGHAVISEYTTIDVSSNNAASQITHRLAHAISHQWEGLMFKPSQAPYVALDDRQQHPVKLRKDMIPGLGDSADLVVIGGAHDMKYGASEWWTTFYLACVDLTAEGADDTTLHSFRIVAAVSRPAITATDMRFLNRHGKAHYLTPFDVAAAPHIETELTGQPPPTAIFMRPLVVEVVGAGFDRLPNSRFESLRFPRVVKIHSDRSFRDAVTSEQYRHMAERSQHGDINGDGTSFQHWLSRLTECVNRPDTSRSASRTASGSAKSSRKRYREIEEVGGVK